MRVLGYDGIEWGASPKDFFQAEIVADKMQAS
jgi:hypothetical protein